MTVTPLALGDATSLLERLADLLRQETAFLAKQQLAPMRMLVTEKAQLAQAYEATAARLRRDPAPLRQASPTMLAAFGAALRSFETEAARNRRQLEAARTVVERVVRLVARSIEETAGRPATYGPAEIGASRNAYAAPSITLDRRI